jgi:hypothetical protein
MTASDHRAFSKSLAGRGPSIHDGRDLNLPKFRLIFSFLPNVLLKFV